MSEYYVNSTGCRSCNDINTESDGVYVVSLEMAWSDRKSDLERKQKMSYTSCQTWGNNILFRGYDLTGERVAKKVPYCPMLYIPLDKSSTHGQKNLDGHTLKALSFESIKTAKDFIAGQPEKTVFGMNRFEYAYLNDYKSYLQTDCRVLMLDIETECEYGFPEPDLAGEAITVITMKCGDRLVTIGLDKYASTSKTPYKPINSDHEYILCSNEIELVETFIKEWRKMDADVITGWNVNLFDLPYLYNRIKKLLGEKTANKMSPWEIVRSRQVFVRGRQQTSFVFYGMNILDYYDLYRKFTYTQLPNYKLDYVCFVELGEKKLDYKEHDSMHMFYKSDWTKFVEYNVHDVLLVEKLEKKMKLIELALQMASDAKANPQDVFSQVRMWDLLIYNYLIEKNIQIPSRVDVPENAAGQYDGAFVKEPVPGLHEWIISLDVASMYPNAIRFLNISPETVLDNSKIPPSLKMIKSKPAKENIKDIIHNNSDVNKFIEKQAIEAGVSVSPTGDVFGHSQTGFLSDLMEKMFTERKTNKVRAKIHEENADICLDEMKRRGLDVENIK